MYWREGCYACGNWTCEDPGRPSHVFGYIVARALNDSMRKAMVDLDEMYWTVNSDHCWNESIVFEAIRIPASSFFNKEQMGSTKSQTRV
jgi:hypothetical protein